MAFTADASEVLLTLAEISVAFAGFSSIVATFQKRSGDDGASFDHFRFWIMLEFSLASLLFSLLPFALYFAGLSGPAVWSSAGATMVAFIVAHGFGFVFLRRRARAVLDSSITRPFLIASQLIYGSVVISQLLNISNIGLHRGFGPYLFGLLMLMLAAAANFARLVWVGNPPLAR